MVASSQPRGDAAHGQALIQRFECNRCHEGTGEPAPTRVKACFGCHEEILDDKFPAPAATLARWKPVLDPYREAPSLAQAGKRLKASWIAAYLMKPYDLRPNLVSTMPRLGITDAEARDVAAYLTAGSVPEGALGEGASATRGREIAEQRGCGTCHVFSGVPALTQTPLLTGALSQRRAATLAPDLRHTRDRWSAPQLVEWLLDPPKVRPGTLMPTHGLTQAEARDVAAWLLGTPLEPAPVKAVPARLPVLTRRVTYQDVLDAVIGKTCRHCHGDPDIAMGDGGPGNTGGFGFKPRGLNLATYETTGAGLLDDHGERHSVFEKLPDGTPRIVAALIARQKEEAGQIDPLVRGMPIGLPAVSAEAVQIMESWVAQGRPK